MTTTATSSRRRSRFFHVEPEQGLFEDFLFTLLFNLVFFGPALRPCHGCCHVRLLHLHLQRQVVLKEASSVRTMQLLLLMILFAFGLSLLSPTPGRPNVFDRTLLLDAVLW